MSSATANPNAKNPGALPVPKTLLSFIYHTTGTAAYRTQMHMDMERAFDRFNIVDSKVRDACWHIEKAAYDRRYTSIDAGAAQPFPEKVREHATAGVELMEYSQRLFAGTSPSQPGDKLFAALQDELVTFVADPKQTPIDAFAVDGASLKKHLLLDLVYCFFHVPALQPWIVAGADGQVAAAVSRIGDARVTMERVLEAFKHIEANIAGRATDPATLAGEIQYLCFCLAIEYSVRGYLDCW